MSRFRQGADVPEEVLQGGRMVWDAAGAWDWGNLGSNPCSDVSCLSEPA